MNATRTTARRRHALPATVAGLLMLWSPIPAAAEETAVPESARPMTGVELYMLYRNRSWQWADGAGRMQEEGRVFKAWSGSGDDASWAEGRWIVTDTGRLCMQADWQSAADTVADRTCFSHLIDGRTIYQKKEPEGEWYVFRHAEPQETDEFAKLVREDLVTARLEELRNPPRAPDPEETSVVRQSLNHDARGEVQ